MYEDDQFGVQSQIGRFGIVPLWVIQQGLTGSELAVYVTLRCYADRDSGKAFPSQRKIAEDVRLSVETVKRALAGLKQRDLIRSKQWHRKDGSTGGCNYWLRDVPPPDPQGYQDTPPLGVAEMTHQEQTNEQSSETSVSVAADAADAPEDDMQDDELFPIADVDPSAEKRIAAREADREKNKRAQELTKEYTRRVPLSKFPAVLKVVKRALDTGHADDRVRAALAELADNNRSVTVDALRIAIDMLPPPPPPPRPCPCCAGAKQGKLSDLCQPCSDNSWSSRPCVHPERDR